jgi:hypothetical protein
MFSIISDNISLSNPNLTYYEISVDFVLPCELFIKEKSIIDIEEVNLSPGDTIAIGIIYLENVYSPINIFFYKPKSQPWQPFTYKMGLGYDFVSRNEPVLWTNVTKQVSRDNKLNQILN